MRGLSYLLEICGWALIVFTLAWTMTGTGSVSSGNNEPNIWDHFLTFGRLFGYILEGVILGLIAVLLARIARHPDAPTLVGQAVRMSIKARQWNGKSDD